MPGLTTGRRYFLVISLVLLGIVFLGFAPTFYLRPLFGKIDGPTGSTGLPLHLILHGLALSSWYVLLCVQAALISVGRTAVHRRLGVAGVVSAMAVVASGTVVLTRAVPRRMVEGVLPPPELLEGFREVALSQTFNLTLFAVCVGAAIYFRRRADVHKRLMVIASILVIGAALSTNRDFGAALQGVLPGFLPVGRTADVLLISSLLAFDLTSRRKLFAATVFGLALILLVRPVWMSLMLHSELGIRWTNWLGRIPV